jgi:hypothetical protein
MSDDGTTMRVLRTELYFIPVEWEERFGRKLSPFTNPAISAAWFRAPQEISTVHVLRALEEYTHLSQLVLASEADPLETSRNFFDRVLEPENYLEPPKEGKRLVLNPAIGSELGKSGEGFAEAVLDLEIVIEQSPPSLETLKSIIKKSPGVAIGTYIGFTAVGESHPALLFAAVPMGIVVVGSAIGISRALERGLNHAIEASFKRLLK